MVARTSRISGRSSASGWSVRSSTATPFLPLRMAPTRSPGKGRNMVRSTTPTFSLRVSRSQSATASACTIMLPMPRIR
ncbi:MAG: hypothetical protein L6Q52_07980 [Rhodocyclaceae bacterium]|nr:hypothetical protein [Rhodocyclaceae bacterium]